MTIRIKCEGCGETIEEDNTPEGIVLLASKAGRHIVGRLTAKVLARRENHYHPTFTVVKHPPGDQNG